MNAYMDFLLYLMTVMIMGFFALVILGVKKGNKRWQSAIDEAESEKNEILSQCQNTSVRHMEDSIEIEAAHINLKGAVVASGGITPALTQTINTSHSFEESPEVYVSRAERRKNGERGSFELSAKLPKKSKGYH